MVLGWCLTGAGMVRYSSVTSGDFVRMGRSMVGFSHVVSHTGMNTGDRSAFGAARCRYSSPVQRCFIPLPGMAAWAYCVVDNNYGNVVELVCVHLSRNIFAKTAVWVTPAQTAVLFCLTLSVCGWQVAIPATFFLKCATSVAQNE